MVESDAVGNVVLVDSELSSRLERTEGLASARFIEARQRQSPDATPAPAWIEVGNAFVMFDGVDSPLTQSFGLVIPSYTGIGTDGGNDIRTRNFIGIDIDFGSDFAIDFATDSDIDIARVNGIHTDIEIDLSVPLAVTM